jgi:hypothetical protein
VTNSTNNKTRFISGNHVFDINKCVLAAVSFEHLQRLLNQVTYVRPFVLAVVNSIASVYCDNIKSESFKAPLADLISLQLTVFALEEVEHGQDLSVVGHQGLSH